jgi:protoporphyrinogen oxidase
MDIGILGGGISGLVTASRLTASTEVLEADDRPGGLARTFGTDGFYSDVGGHIMFSKDAEALSTMIEALGENVHQRRRANVIAFDGAMVKYPFENGLSGLPNKQDVLECLEGFVRAWAQQQAAPNAPSGDQHLGDWCLRLFGPGIANKYLIPYNRKIWKRDVTELSTEWVDRVPMPPLTDVLKSAIGIETEGYVHQLYFHYPKVGGIEALARAFAAQVVARGHRLTLGFRASGIRRSDRGWVVTDGKEEREYRRLVSTIPILPMLQMLPEVPSEVLSAAKSLAYNSLRVVLVGVAKPDLDQYTAVYVPDERSIYHRVCFNNAFSPSMAPQGASSVSVEITCKPGDHIHDLDDETLGERVVSDLARDGLVARKDVVVRHVHREKYAYVVYDHGYTARVKVVRDYLDSLGIEIAGRFAEYRYVNMDACVRRALDLAKSLEASS